jgi:hypothetical protein
MHWYYRRLLEEWDIGQLRYFVRYRTKLRTCPAIFWDIAGITIAFLNARADTHELLQ